MSRPPVRPSQRRIRRQLYDLLGITWGRCVGCDVPLPHEHSMGGMTRPLHDRPICIRCAGASTVKNT